MKKLSSKSCKACHQNSPPLSEKKKSSYITQLNHWDILLIEDVQRLTRLFTFKNFVDALAFTNSVGDLAEKENHHPAILTEWGRVQVTWWTHSIGGLHDNDFILAARTDILFEETS